MKKNRLQAAFFFLMCISVVACKKDKNNNNENELPNPIAAYDFKGNANDNTNQHNGGIIGSISNVADSFGNLNAAYFFPGNAYVKIPDADLLDFQGNQFTISAWIRPVKINGTYIVHKSATGGSGGGPYSLDIFPGKSRVIIHTVDDEAVALTGTSSIKKNVWQQLVATCNGTELVLYYNGNKEATGSVPLPLQSSTGALTIGSYEFVFPGASFEGTIDNVRIFDKALTEAQVMKLYNNYQQ